MPLTHEMRIAQDAWEKVEADQRLLSKYRCGTCPPYRACPWTCVTGAYVPDVAGPWLAVTDAEAGYTLAAVISDEPCDTLHTL
jgi:hypothetical protein